MLNGVISEGYTWCWCDLQVSSRCNSRLSLLTHHIHSEKPLYTAHPRLEKINTCTQLLYCMTDTHCHTHIHTQPCKQSYQVNLLWTASLCSQIVASKPARCLLLYIERLHWLFEPYTHTHTQTQISTGAQKQHGASRLIHTGQILTVISHTQICWCVSPHTHAITHKCFTQNNREIKKACTENGGHKEDTQPHTTHVHIHKGHLHTERHTQQLLFSWWSII